MQCFDDIVEAAKWQKLSSIICKNLFWVPDDVNFFLCKLVKQRLPFLIYSNTTNWLTLHRILRDQAGVLNKVINTCGKCEESVPCDYLQSVSSLITFNDKVHSTFRAGRG